MGKIKDFIVKNQKKLIIGCLSAIFATASLIETIHIALAYWAENEEQQPIVTEPINPTENDFTFYAAIPNIVNQQGYEYYALDSIPYDLVDSIEGFAIARYEGFSEIAYIPEYPELKITFVDEKGKTDYRWYNYDLEDVKNQSKFNESKLFTIPVTQILGGYYNTYDDLGSNGFNSTSIVRHVIIPRTINYVYDGAFNGMPNLEKVTILGTTNYIRKYNVMNEQGKLFNEIKFYSDSTFENEEFDTLVLQSKENISYYVSSFDHAYYEISTMNLDGKTIQTIDYTSIGTELFVPEGSATYVSGYVDYSDKIYFEDGAFTTKSGTKILASQIASTNTNSSVIDFDGKSVQFIWQDDSHNGSNDLVSYSFKKSNGEPAKILHDQYNGNLRYKGGTQNPGEDNPCYFYTTIIPEEDVASIMIGDYQLSAALDANTKYTLRFVKGKDYWTLTTVKYTYKINYTASDGRIVEDMLSLNVKEDSFEEYSYDLGVYNYPTLKVYETKTIYGVNEDRLLTSFDVSYLNASYASENHKYQVKFSPCHIYNSIHYYNEMINDVDYLLEVKTQSRIGVERIYYLNEIISVNDDKIIVNFTIPEYWDGYEGDVYLKAYSLYDKTQEVLYYDGKSNPTTNNEAYQMTKVGSTYKYEFDLDYGAPMYISFYRLDDSGKIIEGEDVPWTLTGAQTTSNTFTLNGKEYNYSYESEALNNEAIKSTTSAAVYTVKSMDNHVIHGTTNQYIYLDLYKGTSEIPDGGGIGGAIIGSTKETDEGIYSTYMTNGGYYDNRYKEDLQYIKVIFYKTNAITNDNYEYVVNHNYKTGDDLYYIEVPEGYNYCRFLWYSYADEKPIGDTNDTNTNGLLPVVFGDVYQGHTRLRRSGLLMFAYTFFSKEEAYQNGLDPNYIYVNASYITKTNYDILYAEQKDENGNKVVSKFEEVKTYYYKATSDATTGTRVEFDNAQDLYTSEISQLYIDATLKYPINDYFIRIEKIPNLDSFKMYVVSNYSIFTEKEQLSIIGSYEFIRNNANSSFEEYYYDGEIGKYIKEYNATNGTSLNATYLISSFLNDGEAGEKGIYNSYGTTTADSSLGAFSLDKENTLLLFTPNENCEYSNVSYNVIDETGNVVSKLSFDRNATSKNGYQTFVGTVPLRGRDDSYFKVVSTGNNPQVIGYFILLSNGNYQFVASSESKALSSGSSSIIGGTTTDTKVDLTTSDDIYSTIVNQGSSTGIDRQYDYYLIGSFNNWKVSNSYGLVYNKTLTDNLGTGSNKKGSVYTITGIFLNKGDKFRISTGDAFINTIENVSLPTDDIIYVNDATNSDYRKYIVQTTGYYNINVSHTTTNINIGNLNLYSNFQYKVTFEVNNNDEVLNESISLYFKDENEWSLVNGNTINYALYHDDTFIASGTMLEKDQNNKALIVNGQTGWLSAKYIYRYASLLPNKVVFSCTSDEVGVKTTVPLSFTITEQVKATGCIFFTPKIVNKEVAKNSDNNAYLYNDGTEYLYTIRSNKNWSVNLAGLLYDVKNDRFFAEDVQLDVGQQVLIYDWQGKSYTLNQDYSWDYVANASQALIVGKNGSYLVTLQVTANGKIGRIVEYTLPYVDTTDTELNNSIVLVSKADGLVSATYSLQSTFNRTQFYADIILAQNYTIRVSYKGKTYSYTPVGLSEEEKTYRLYFSAIENMNLDEYHEVIKNWDDTRCNLSNKEFLEITFSPAAIFDGSYINIDYDSNNIKNIASTGNAYSISFKEQTNEFYAIVGDKKLSMLWVNDFGGGIESEYSVYTTTVTTIEANQEIRIVDKDGNSLLKKPFIICFPGTYVIYYCGSEIYYNHDTAADGSFSNCDAVRVQGETNYFLYIANKVVYDSLTNKYNNEYEEYKLDSTFIVPNTIKLENNPIKVTDANENVVSEIKQVTLYDYIEVPFESIVAENNYYYYNKDSKSYSPIKGGNCVSGKTYYRLVINNISSIEPGVYDLDYSIDNRRRQDDTYFVFTYVKLTRLPASSINLFYYQNQYYNEDETYFATNVYVQEKVTSDNFDSLKDKLVEFVKTDELISGKTYYVITGTDPNGNPILSEVMVNAFEKDVDYYVFNKITKDDTYDPTVKYYYYGFTQVDVDASNFNDGEYFYYQETTKDDVFSPDVTYYIKTGSGYVPTAVSIFNPNVTYYVMKQFDDRIDTIDPNITYYVIKKDENGDDVFIESKLTVNTGLFVIGDVGTLNYIEYGTQIDDTKEYYIYFNNNGTETYTKVDKFYIDPQSGYYKIEYVNQDAAGNRKAVTLTSLDGAKSYFKYVDGHYESVNVIALSDAYYFIDDNETIYTNETVRLDDKSILDVDYYSMDINQSLTYEENQYLKNDTYYYVPGTTNTIINKGAAEDRIVYSKQDNKYVEANPNLANGIYYTMDTNSPKLNTIGDISNKYDKGELLVTKNGDNYAGILDIGDVILDNELYFERKINEDDEGVETCPVKSHSYVNGFSDYYFKINVGQNVYDKDGNEVELHFYNNVDGETNGLNYQYGSRTEGFWPFRVYYYYTCLAIKNGDSYTKVNVHDTYDPNQTYYKAEFDENGNYHANKDVDGIVVDSVYVYRYVNNSQYIATFKVDNNGKIVEDAAYNNFPNGPLMIVDFNNSELHYGTSVWNKSEVTKYSTTFAKKDDLKKNTWYTNGRVTNSEKYTGDIKVRTSIGVNESITLYPTNQGENQLIYDQVINVYKNLNKTYNNDYITYSNLLSIIDNDNISNNRSTAQLSYKDGEAYKKYIDLVTNSDSLSGNDLYIAIYKLIKTSDYYSVKNIVNEQYDPLVDYLRKTDDNKAIVQVQSGESMYLDGTYYKSPTKVDNSTSLKYLIDNDFTTLLVKNNNEYIERNEVSLDKVYYVISNGRQSNYYLDRDNRTLYKKTSDTTFEVVLEDTFNGVYVTAEQYENMHQYDTTGNEKYFALTNNDGKNILTQVNNVKLDQKYYYDINARATIKDELYVDSYHYFTYDAENGVYTQVSKKDALDTSVEGRYYISEVTQGKVDFVVGEDEVYTIKHDEGSVVDGILVAPVYRPTTFEEGDFTTAIRNGGYYYFKKATVYNDATTYYQKNNYLSLAGNNGDGKITENQFRISLNGGGPNGLNIIYYVMDEDADLSRFDPALRDNYFVGYIYKDTYIKAEFPELKNDNYYDKVDGVPSSFNEDSIYFVLSSAALSEKVIDVSTLVHDGKGYIVQPYEFSGGTEGYEYYYYGSYNQFVEKDSVISLVLYQSLGNNAPTGKRFAYWSVDYQDSVSLSNGGGTTGAKHYSDGAIIDLKELDGPLVLYPVFEEAKYVVTFSTGVGYSIEMKQNGVWERAQATTISNSELEIRIKIEKGYTKSNIMITGVDDLIPTESDGYIHYTIPSTITDDVNVRVFVIANTYSAFLDLNPSGNFTSNKDYRLDTTVVDDIVYNQSYTFPIPVKVEANVGYIFVGWFDQNDTQITNYLGKTLKSWSFDYDVTLYAHWTNAFSVNIERTYIEITKEGETVELKKETLTLNESYGNSVSVTVDNIPGYECDEGSIKIYTEAGNVPYSKTEKMYSFTMPLNNVDFKVTYIRKLYKIEYDLSSGTLAEGLENPTEFTVDTETFTLNNPTKVGYSFVGWKSTDGTTAKTVIINKGSVGDRKYVAVFTPEVYTISMRVQPTGEVKIQEYTIETETFTLTAPTVKGYTFSLFTDTSNNSTYTEIVIEKGTIGNKSYRCDYIPVTYSYSCYALEEDDTTCAAGTYTVLSNDISIPAPERRGYAFLGWSLLITDEGCEDINEITGPNAKIIKGSTGNRRYIARWEVVSYNIKYNLNGGSYGEDVVVPAQYNIEISVVIPTPSLRGYTFKGWYVNGEYVAYTGEDYVISIGNAGDITLEANWEKTIYTITYQVDVNGHVGALPDGETSFGPDTYMIDTPTFTLNNPYVEGYTFLGWKEEGEDDSLYQNPMTITINSVGNHNFVAVYSPNEYVVTYDCNGGNSLSSSTVTYDQEYTLKVPTRVAYEFAGWYIYLGLDENENKIYVPLDSNGIWTMADDVTVVAMWVPTIYTIEIVYPSYIDTDGNVVEQRIQKGEYTIETDSMIINLAEEIIGYTFINWTLELQLEKDGEILTSNVDYIQIIKGDSYGNRRYLANYEAIEYSLTYDLNGGSVSNNPTQFTIETETFSLNNPTRVGYNFTGWKVYVDGKYLEPTSENFNSVIAKGSINNRLYIATWEPIVYTLTYDLAGGTLSGENPSSYTIETSTFSLNNPTRLGYKFLGWIEEVDGTSKPANDHMEIAQGSIGNRKYIASWEEIVYTVTYQAINVETGKACIGDIIKNGIRETFTVTNPITFNVSNAISVNGYSFSYWEIENTNGVYEDIVVKAYFTINTYNVSYKVVNQSGNILFGYTYNTTIRDTFTVENPIDFTTYTPSLDGYEFKSWSKENTSSVYNDLEVVGTMEVIVYRATLSYVNQNNSVLNGVEGLTTIDFSVENPIDFTKLNASKAGYSFNSNNSWLYNDSSITSTNGIYEDINVVGKLTVIEYHVTYKAVNSKGDTLSNATTSAPTIFTVENPIVFIDYTMNRDGYSFSGWDRVNTSATYEDIVVTASMTPITYKITYEYKSTSGIILTEVSNNAPTTYIVEDVIDFVNDDYIVTKQGYNFKSYSIQKLENEYGDKIVTVTLEPITYTITYKVLSSSGKDITTSANLSSLPTTYTAENKVYFSGRVISINGYEFGSWSISSTEGYFENLDVTINMNLLTYTITYKVLSSSGKDITLKVDLSSLPTEFTVENEVRFNEYYITSSGYAFSNWDKNNTTSTYKDIVVTASMTPITYKITYEYKSTSGISLTEVSNNAPTTYIVEDVIDYDNYQATKLGYNFKSYSIQRLENEYGNKIVTVTLEPITYTISFEYGEALGSTIVTKPYPSSITYTIESNSINLSNPSRDGYVFNGWKDDGYPISVIKAGSHRDYELKASWTAKQYTLEFNSGEGSNVSSFVVTFDQPYSLSQPTLRGYEFVGWYYNGELLDQNGNWTYDCGDNKKTVTLNAIWDIIHYKITYNLNGGENNPNNPSTFTVKDKITLADASKPGYDFVYWVIGELTRISVIDGTTMQDISDIVLNAVYKVHTYNITYKIVNYDWEERTGNNFKINNNTTYTVKNYFELIDGSAEGYEFIGWYLEINNEESEITSLSGYLEDLTIYGRFKVIEYDINYKYVKKGSVDTIYNASDVIVSNTNSTKYSIEKPVLNDEIIKDNITVKEGYIVNSIGSYDDENYFNSITYETYKGASIDIYVYIVPPMRINYKYVDQSGNPISEDYITNTSPTLLPFGKNLATSGDGVLLVNPSCSLQGYVFDNWYEDKNGSTVFYNYYNNNLDAELTIYVRFLSSVNINYVYIDADTKEEIDSSLVTNPNPTKVVYGKSYNNGGNITCEGYTYQAMYLNSDLSGEAVYYIDSITEELTLYVKMRKN
ncbi:MAG: InlB B-repeat-containing protein [Bacillales bacterium]|nr:InlB B-repeat-containing protein [Bacillales bacterium]